jgi:hypothetical protein
MDCLRGDWGGAAGQSAAPAICTGSNLGKIGKSREYRVLCASARTKMPITPTVVLSLLDTPQALQEFHRKRREATRQKGCRKPCTLRDDVAFRQCSYDTDKKSPARGPGYRDSSHPTR